MAQIRSSVISCPVPLDILVVPQLHILRHALMHIPSHNLKSVVNPNAGAK
jgi:hypothetical protein